MESVKGLKKLLNTLEKLPKEMDTEVDIIVESNAQDIERDAKRLAPKDTGYLARSIYTNKVKPKTYKVASYASYAPFVEYGKPIGTGPNGGPKPFLFPAFRMGVKRFRKDLEKFLDIKFGKI
mgnify:CR=1 FL=1